MIAAVAALLAIAGVGLWKAGLLPGASTSGGGADRNLDLSLMPIGFGDKCGFVGPDGKIVINPQYDGAGFFRSDLDVAPVKIGGKWGLIDRNGQYTANPQFDYVAIWGGSSVIFARTGDRWGIIDKSGTFIINPQFTEIGAFDSRGRAVAGMGGKAGLIDRTGKFVLQPEFDQIGSREAGGVTEYFHDGLAAARQGDSWGYIDESGRWVINPQFASAGAFGEGGLAPVQVGAPGAPANPPLMSADGSTPAPAKWGYVDKTGKLVIQPQFDGAGDFSGAGLAPVSMGGSWGFIDKTGAVRINPQYSWAAPFLKGPDGWLARVAVAGPANAQGSSPWRWGFVDSSGATKINPQFASLEDFDENGRAAVGFDNNVGLVDASGRLVINPVFERLQLIPGTGRYLYVRKAQGGATQAYEVGQLDRDGKVLSTVRGGVCMGS